MSSIPLILLSVLINAAAQILLKHGMIQVGHFEYSVSSMPAVIERVVLNPTLWLAVTCYVVSLMVWMAVLSRVDVSFAYPFVSVGYVVTTVAGYMLFNEAVTPGRVAGIALIALGVIIVARS